MTKEEVLKLAKIDASKIIHDEKEEFDDCVVFRYIQERTN